MERCWRSDVEYLVTSFQGRIVTNFTGVRESVSLKYRNQAPVQQEDPVGQLSCDVLCRTATRANKGLSGSMMSGGSREADAGARRAHDDYTPEHNSPYFSARWSYSPTASASVDPLYSDYLYQRAPEDRGPKAPTQMDP